MLKKSSVRTIVLIWIAWAAILFLFQAIVPMRLGLRRPDLVLDWTPSETGAHSQDDKPYLIDPFLNEHVAWDSEYYLSIAVGGYDDPIMRRIPIPGSEPVSQNYAFFPLYSHVMQVVMIPLGILGLNPIATATLAGLIVGLIGTLFGMIGLYDLAREELGEDGAIRAAFYLLIFPTGFFLAQVYTEGLFIGLAFCSLALMRHHRLFWAALLAALAVWTRAVGVALLIPLALAWGHEVNWKQLNWRIFARG
ncbi:MAG TPA: mannosyltransferase family protein, partial [Anaerolineae bacterium]